ncbi:hypothetical protein TEA_000884 [Camellia sinensis var. sinensis]|uniref:Uncharacterized protein n=1 Tax=Camellia sinensis var. sinensis TaxID=542762 RepID=A0A4V3WRD8_CAMSN|nr:hypothetical protein TEA_000884 [Camellia sinensis var. sinensis]
MYSFPQPGSVTICEINRDFITAENLSDDRAKETYAKVLGIVFSAVSFRTDHLLPSPNPEQGSEQLGRIDESVQRNSWSAALQGIFINSLKLLFHPNDVKLLPEVDLHGVSWHRHKHILAFISGPNHVTIRDYEDSERKEPCILTHESQRDVKLLEWRPNGGRTLSVACKQVSQHFCILIVQLAQCFVYYDFKKIYQQLCYFLLGIFSITELSRGRICIWTASYPGNAASVRSGVTSGTIARGAGTRWTLVDFLRSHDDEQISALSWSPDGRYPNYTFSNSSTYRSFYIPALSDCPPLRYNSRLLKATFEGAPVFQIDGKCSLDPPEINENQETPPRLLLPNLEESIVSSIPESVLSSSHYEPDEIVISSAFLESIAPISLLDVERSIHHSDAIMVEEMFRQLMGHFIFGRQTHGHQNLGPQPVALSRRKEGHRHWDFRREVPSEIGVEGGGDEESGGTAGTRGFLAKYPCRHDTTRVRVRNPDGIRLGKSGYGIEEEDMAYGSKKKDGIPVIRAMKSAIRASILRLGMRSSSFELSAFLSRSFSSSVSSLALDLFISFFSLGATWDPDGGMILVAFSESLTLGSVHFASKPPSLDAHLLPVDLSEIQSLTHSRGIEKIAWDASGDRLALSYKDGDELYRGLIAICDVKRTPLISASLIGFIRGPGDNPRPLAFSFHDKFKQGPLLTVCKLYKSTLLFHILKQVVYHIPDPVPHTGMIHILGEEDILTFFLFSLFHHLWSLSTASYPPASSSL